MNIQKTINYHFYNQTIFRKLNTKNKFNNLEKNSLGDYKNTEISLLIQNIFDDNQGYDKKRK